MATSSILRFGSSTLLQVPRSLVLLILLVVLKNSLEWLNILSLCIIIKGTIIVKSSKLLTYSTRLRWFLIIGVRPLYFISCLLLVKIETVYSESFRGAFKLVNLIFFLFLLSEDSYLFNAWFLSLRRWRLHHEHRRVNRVRVESPVRSWKKHERDRVLGLLGILSLRRGHHWWIIKATRRHLTWLHIIEKWWKGLMMIGGLQARYFVFF